MADIFICYSRKDKTIAAKLVKIFKDRGWSVFIDVTIQPGQRFDQVIKHELQQARAAVALWSAHSVDSDYVLDEASEAKRLGILVPVRIEDVERPYGFGRIQTADLLDWHGSLDHNGLCEHLLPALEKLLGKASVEALEKIPAEITPAAPSQKPLLETITTFPTSNVFEHPGKSFRDTLKNGEQGPEMVVIPSGRFLMGSAQGEGNDDERPQHEVIIPQAFAMGRYPVTFADYDVFAQESSRALPDDEGWGRGKQPVINVSWEDAAAYCQWLSDQTGRTYRLPSEAQWEYAARAGTTSRYWWGDEPGKNRGNFDGSGSQWSGKQTSPVDAFAANPFGLFDVHGNVWEWCLDNWHDNYNKAPNDGSAWITDEKGPRALRGGSWYSLADLARAAYRFHYHPYLRNYNLGFRVCCVFPIND